MGQILHMSKYTICELFVAAFYEEFDPLQLAGRVFVFFSGNI